MLGVDAAQLVEKILVGVGLALGIELPPRRHLVADRQIGRVEASVALSQSLGQRQIRAVMHERIGQPPMLLIEPREALMELGIIDVQAGDFFQPSPRRPEQFHRDDWLHHVRSRPRFR
jgi:hypothetical protein